MARKVKCSHCGGTNDVKGINGAFFGPFDCADCRAEARRLSEASILGTARNALAACRDFATGRDLDPLDLLPDATKATLRAAGDIS
jgi:hypothetical protein